MFIAGSAVADPPVSSPPADADTPPPSGNFFSTLKQAFKQDLDKEVVRGHFDVGTAPDSHRYYCLVDTKTGKREENGVAGQPSLAADGTTRIKAGAVSLYSCAQAERQGILITVGYPSVDVAKTADARPAIPPVEDRKAAADGDPTRMDIVSVFGRFLAARNAHDRAGVAGTLSESMEFIFAPAAGAAVRGRGRALDAIDEDWQHHGAWETSSAEAQVVELSGDAAVLMATLAESPPAATGGAAKLRWTGVMVKTRAGWRIGSIVVTSLGW
jgi:hypothetical protein